MIRIIVIIMMMFPTVLMAQQEQDTEGLIDILQTDMEVQSATALQQSDHWKCEMSQQFACKEEGCNEILSSEWLELDFIKKTYMRCNEEECNGYHMVFNRSGVFVVVALPKNGITLKVSDQDGKFSEAASMAGLVINSFGICKPKTANELKNIIKEPVTKTLPPATIMPNYKKPRIIVPEQQLPQSMQKDYKLLLTPDNSHSGEFNKPFRSFMESEDDN